MRSTTWTKRSLRFPILDGEKKGPTIGRLGSPVGIMQYPMTDPWDEHGRTVYLPYI